MTVIVSPAYAGVEALPTPRQARRSGQPRACGGEGEFVAEAITTRRRSVSVMVFLPERCTLTRWAGIEDVWFIFNPRRLLLPVLAVTVRRPGEPQCFSPAYAGVEARDHDGGSDSPGQPRACGGGGRSTLWW